MVDADIGGSAHREDHISSDYLQDLERFVQSVQDGLSQLKSVGSNRSGGAGDPQGILSSPMTTEISATRDPRLSMRRRQSSTVTRASPSSFESMLKLAQSSLTDNGTIPSINEEVFSVTSCEAATAEEDSIGALVHAGHPILALGESTANSLVDTFASHVGVMYPCVDMATIRRNLTHLYHLISSSGRGSTANLRLIDIEILKAVMMVGAAAKSSEPSSLAETLEQSLLWTAQSVCSQESVEIEDVVMSCLMCIYFFHRDERQKAWRMAGIGARTALELGLDIHEPHEVCGVQKTTSEFEQSDSYDLRRRLLFCCVYDLDSWSSFLTGLPRVLSTQLPPDHLNCLQPRTHKYLRAMLEMDRIGADIFALLREPDQAADSLGTRTDYLEFRLKNMERTTGLEKVWSEEKDQDCAIPRAVQLFIQTRANHFRISIQLRLLASARIAATRPHFFQALVGAADDNVWVCKTAWEGGSIPALLRPTFVHFLMAAISAMVLAAIYDPGRYSVECRRPFEAGLEMLEAWYHTPRGMDSRHRYSLAKLRNLGRRVRISNNKAGDGSLIDDDSAVEPLTAFALHDTSTSDTNLEQSWNTLTDDAFTIGGMSTQMQPWDERWLDSVFNDQCSWSSRQRETSHL
ncbi:uncharacterized protein A1O5_05619 [Cladophialophora psammophila CBS 110553]|uniref:Xylanolytic transcriptional activator regulatory domain-containing protein n=1 Tax=Cladophialophora psammophila CBS 110553 TaxID=1182543 RepID=W9XN86_9EURO|nr:uncharacterized protein A1O5_05619 [Cladophialophora psammophila CBS 110553]EXJ71809.1 hypothetical protein A1O5_05619 [Cladophialophora psammophila CBS 110553]